MRTLKAALGDATAILKQAGVASPLHDARLIAASFLGCSPLNVVLHGEDPVPDQFDAAIQRRAQREPLQHIVGRAPMGHLDLHIGPGVFIPRPETELLADWVVRAVSDVDKPVVVDLCTGSGAVAAYIASTLVDANLTAVELDPRALDWARRNFQEFAPQVRLVQGDVTDANLLPDLHGLADVVVSNPPYVPETESLEPEVYFDPHHSVFAGESGMDVITEMIDLIHRLLKPGGLVGVEHDDTTAAQVREVFSAHGGFDKISTKKDLAGRERFITASKLMLPCSTRTSTKEKHNEQNL